MNQKISTIVGTLIIIIMVLTAAAFLFKVVNFDMENLYQPIVTKTKKKPAETACTMEAMLCPDGSYVSRTGPNCEFAACPGEPANSISDIAPIDVEGWKTYRNEEYGFELAFPDRWKNVEVMEIDNITTFNLQRSADVAGTNEYGQIFTIAAFSKTKWEENQDANDPSVNSYLNKNDDYIFGYKLGQDDEGYVGFSVVKPNEIYKGPYWDVENIILPSFKFIN